MLSRAVFLATALVGLAGTADSFASPSTSLPSSTRIHASADNGAHDDHQFLREMEERNRARAKFGLAPLAPEEYSALREQIDDMGARVRAAHAATGREADGAERDDGRSGSGAGAQGVMGALRGFVDAVVGDTCESHFDCTRPEVCCDLGFRRMCCDGGRTSRDPMHGEYALVPVPVTVPRSP